MLDDIGYAFAQAATENPLVPVLIALIICLSPVLVLRLALPGIRSLLMVLESLGLGFAFNWATTHSADSSESTKKLRKKRHSRNKSDSNAINSTDDGRGSIYPGLVNVSGTYCFMNSTLQALASLSYLKPYLDELHQRAVDLDVPSPVIDAVRDIVIQLNTPHHHRRALRPMQIIDVLSNPAPGQKTSMLFSSMQHQDAQELFQLVSECIKNEAGAVDKEGSRDRGFGTLLQSSERRIAPNPFDGLTANRRSCVDCGYTEAVMHFAFDNWQLSVPRQNSCRLEDCLADYTRLEILTDCICRRCSMVATHNRLVQEVERLAEGKDGDESVTYSKKKRGRETRKLEARVKALLDEGRIEEEVKGLKMERVFSSASTKQAMIARPPPVLVLHLNRSMHFGTYAGKNPCHVLFPEVLDLTPFTTSGQLSTRPEAPISTPPGPLSRSLTPTPANYAAPRVLYRLAAVVCHYGAHNFGHYVAFRRKPPVVPPALPHPLGCPCEACARGAPWLRISDDSVEDVPLARVLAETQSSFMLYYERVAQPQALPNASEETLRPPKPDAPSSEQLVQVQEPGVKRARSVARVVHAFGRASRSPSVLQDAAMAEHPPAVEAATVITPVEADEAVFVQPVVMGPASEDPATVVAKDIEEAVSDAAPVAANGNAPEVDAPTSPLSPASPSSSRTSKRKGKVKRPPATVELRA